MRDDDFFDDDIQQLDGDELDFDKDLSEIMLTDEDKLFGDDGEEDTEDN